VFISCVSAEFRSYRNALRTTLTNSIHEIKVQEDFSGSGGLLLEKLDDYIRSCDAIIHLIGEDSGWLATAAEVETILARYPDFTTKLPQFADDVETYSYTQWEAYLAIYHQVRCFHFIAAEGSQREPNWQLKASEQSSQQQHLERIYQRGHDRMTISFIDPKDVALEFQNALLTSSAHHSNRPVSWPVIPEKFEYKLADREEEFAFFLKLLNEQSKQRILLLQGASGIGKTALLESFAETSRTLGFLCGHIEFKGGIDLQEALKELTRDLKPVRFSRFDREYQRNATHTLRSAFLDDLDDAVQPVVIVLDTYEQASDETKQWLESSLLPHVRRSPHLRLVLAGQNVPSESASGHWQQCAQRRQLPPIAEAHHWCSFNKEHGFTSLPDDHIASIVKACVGHPEHVLRLFENLRTQEANNGL
jgi:hypothetical protein